MKLPLSFVEEMVGQYTVYDSIGDVIASYEKWDYSIIANSEDMKIMVDSTNSFLEAIRLLKVVLESIPKYDYGQGEKYETALYSQVNEFLTKLEEDENI